MYVGPPSKGGLHHLMSIFQLISLHDDIEIVPSEVGAHVIKFENQDVPLDNTCSKLMSIMSSQLKQFWQVRVVKHIPSGAGLGGGSSNAAALLLALNELECLDLTISDMESIAQQVGSDVPFFLHGGQALVTGTGEHILPNQSLIHCDHFVLILPNIHCSTGAVYGALDSAGEFDDLETITDEVLKKVGHNRLLDAAMMIAPELAQLYDKVSNVLDENVFMSGSGSTLYVPCHSETEQQHIYAQLGAELVDFNGILIKAVGV